jgi:hypothetical protein
LLVIRIGRGEFTTFKVNSTLNLYQLEGGLHVGDVVFRCFLVEWKMTKRKKGKDH